jgi:hypothetical protein
MYLSKGLIHVLYTIACDRYIYRSTGDAETEAARCYSRAGGRVCRFWDDWKYFLGISFVHSLFSINFTGAPSKL